MKKTPIVSALRGLLGLIMLVSLLTNCGKKKTAVFSTAGTVEGKEVNISAMIAGRITTVCCREGDLVRKDQVLIELESDELKAAVAEATAAAEKARTDIDVHASSIESARAEVAGVEAKIQSAVAEVERTRINIEEAERELERAKALYNKQVISRAALDLAQTAYRVAVANADVAKAERIAAMAAKDAATARLKNALDLLAFARSGHKVAEAELALSQAKLAQTVITCPMDATVVYMALERGEIAAPGVALMTLVDMTQLYVRVDVEESVVANLALQAPAVIRSQGGAERRLTGRVIEIGQYADFATQRDVSRGRQDIKTFKVKIGLDDNDGFLKPGMTVMVDITLKDRQ